MDDRRGDSVEIGALELSPQLIIGLALAVFLVKTFESAYDTPLARLLADYVLQFIGGHRSDGSF